MAGEMTAMIQMVMAARLRPAFLAGSVALALAACVPAASSERPRPGMANPASVHCLEQGGRLIPVRTPQGQSNDCLLPSGERVDEWALFRRDRR